MPRKTRKRGQQRKPASETGACTEALTEADGIPRSCDASASGHDQDTGDDDHVTEPETRANENHTDGGRVIEAVESNTLLLQQMLEQLTSVQQAIASDRTSADPDGAIETPSGFDSVQTQDSDTLSEECKELESEVERLRDRVFELEYQLEEVESQNSDLASQVASTNVREAVSSSGSDASEALSWEDRKQLILEQLEEETFDADEFVANLSCESIDQQALASEGPYEFVERLMAEQKRLNAELSAREQEVHELRCLLDDQSGTREGGVAIGAAAIAGLIDADELVDQERERLQLLQAEWEEKFRQGEIQASLERAKLSRERLELAKTKADLEEQLEHLRRQSRHEVESGSGTSRKWLAKLGLQEENAK